MSQKFHIKKNDVVVVIAGSHKGKSGKVLEIRSSKHRAVVEGVATAASIARLAERLGIEMPIAAGVDALLHRGEAISAVIDLLLRRPYRAE